MVFDGSGVSPTLVIWNISVDQVWRRAGLLECANILGSTVFPRMNLPCSSIAGNLKFLDEFPCSEIG